MKIERDKIYLNRRGEKIRVVCVDASKNWPIVGITENGSTFLYNSKGTFGEFSRDDLVSEYIKPREFWLGIPPSNAKKETIAVYKDKPLLVRAWSYAYEELVKVREVLE